MSKYIYPLWFWTHKLLNKISSNELTITFNKISVFGIEGQSETELIISREIWNKFLDLLIIENVQTDYGLLTFRNINRNEYCIHYNYFCRLWVFLKRQDFHQWNKTIFYY